MSDLSKTASASPALGEALALAGVLTFAMLTGLGAHVAIPLPPFGVPMTLQTLFVVLAAMCLGPRLGLASMGLYLLAGMIGVPMFAEGNVGLQVILGQTGGYIIGFLACQPAVNAIVRTKDRRCRGIIWLALGVVVAHAIVFGIGVPWLYVVRLTDENPVTWAQAWHGGMVVFLPGMVIKTVIAVLIGLVVVPWSLDRGW